MEATESKVEYNISVHARQRYAERIMGKEDTDVNRFVTLNENKIKTDINKLIQYGELIYTGKQSQKDGKGNMVDVFLKDCWVVIADSRIKNVITLYKIDLGLDDEFNKTPRQTPRIALKNSLPTRDQPPKPIKPSPLHPHW